MKKKKLLIASGNQGKIKEIRAILSSLNLSLISPQDADIDLEVKETGKSYSENARLKAEAYLKAAGIPVLADDSGLEVDALNGAPGLFSARFSPKKNADDADRRDYLIQQLEGKPQPWTARFWCTAILALSDDRFFKTTGLCEGVIIREQRGTGGFGYDPIFLVLEHQATMAELGPVIKNQISHRARALKAMMPVLRQELE
ncbi:MAG: RdgB/HAM1 family non-canonical purine NTP pyrophosphatase [Brevefilum sp.]